MSHIPMLHIVIWEFRVPIQDDRAPAPNSSARTHRTAIGPRCSGRPPGSSASNFSATAKEPGRYLTIDRWESAAAYAAFKTEFAEPYAELDRRCERLTESERRIGAFTSLAASA